MDDHERRIVRSAARHVVALFSGCIALLGVTFVGFWAISSGPQLFTHQAIHQGLIIPVLLVICIFGLICLCLLLTS